MVKTRTNHGAVTETLHVSCADASFAFCLILQNHPVVALSTASADNMSEVQKR